MRLTFKSFFFFSIILVIVAYLIIFVSNQIFVPYFMERKDISADASFQKELEKRVENNASRMLEQLYGKKNYFVSVVTHLHGESEETEKISYEPIRVTQNATEKTIGEFESFKKALSQNKPSAQEIRQEITKKEKAEEQAEIFIPGLVMRNKISPKISEDLPGFPFVEPTMQEEQEEPTAPVKTKKEAPKELPLAGTIIKQDEEAKSQNNQNAKNIVTKESANNIIYYNQVKVKHATPGRKIDKMFVSVMVDEAKFKQANVPMDTLKNHIITITSLDEKRGDELVVSVFPFPQKGVDFNEMYKQYEPQIKQVQAALPKFKQDILSKISCR